MLPRRLRSWLALATLVALASCELNPQPVLPGERAAAGPNLDGGGKATGGTSAVIPEPDDPGATPSAGGAPGEQLGSGGAGPAASGDGGADDGSPGGAQNAGGEAGAGGAGGPNETP